MSTYEDLQDRRVERIAQFLTLPGNIDHGLRRGTLARHLSTTSVPISPGMVTALWPLIEKRIIQIGEERGTPLFPVRPMARWKFKCAATSAPYHSLWMATRRESEQVTRMTNDAIGGLSEQLGRYGHLLDREQEREVWRRIDRRDTYLAAHARHREDLEVMAASLEATILDLPEISVAA